MTKDTSIEDEQVFLQEYFKSGWITKLLGGVGILLGLGNSVLIILMNTGGR